MLKEKSPDFPFTLTVRYCCLSLFVQNCLLEHVLSNIIFVEIVFSTSFFSDIFFSSMFRPFTFNFSSLWLSFIYVVAQLVLCCGLFIYEIVAGLFPINLENLTISNLRSEEKKENTFQKTPKLVIVRCIH